MKKASKILLTVGGALSIAAAVGFILSSIFMFFCATPEFMNLIRQAIAESKAATQVPDYALELLEKFYILFGILFIVWCGLAIVSAILSFKTANKPTKTRLILVIVFSAICGMVPGIVGAILGLASHPEE